MEMELESRPRGNPPPSVEHFALTVLVGFLAWFSIPFVTGYHYEPWDAGWYFWVIVLAIVGLGFILPPYPKWWTFGLSMGQFFYLMIFSFQELWFLSWVAILLIYSIPIYFLFVLGGWLRKTFISGKINPL